jgi:hypothetical protein
MASVPDAKSMLSQVSRLRQPTAVNAVAAWDLTPGPAAIAILNQGRDERWRRHTGDLAKLAGALGFICLTGPAAAAVDVDLELVLAVDVSRSMDLDEQQLQRDGYVAAFRHPEVVQAIRSGAAGRIAVTYMEWSGPSYQQVLVPWTIVGSREDAAAFAASLERTPMMREMGTSISGGLAAAARLFGASGARGFRQVIDVSGDGPNNMGLPVAMLRDQVIEQGIAINGLPIVLKTSGAYSLFNIPDLAAYY